MFSKRELEGYLEIDHRESPGITPEMAAKAGRSTIPVGKGKVFKAPWVKCSHCETMIVLNPKRNRDSDTCAGCDRNLCPRCYMLWRVTGVCKPFKQIIDELMDKLAKAT